MHVYFHKEELELLRRIGARNQLSVRAVVRTIVRDHLIRNAAEITVEIKSAELHLA